jgi:hypothetical protein
MPVLARRSRPCGPLLKCATPGGGNYNGKDMTHDHSIDEGRQAILTALERHQVRYVVIGGAGAQPRGWPEPTDEVSITTTRHGDFDVVLVPDGTSGYEEIIATATPETVPGTGIVVPVASAETILHSKAAAGRPKDRAVIESMRGALGLGDL